MYTIIYSIKHIKIAMTAFGYVWRRLAFTKGEIEINRAG
jgi:hypothetical protein